MFETRWHMLENDNDNEIENKGIHPIISKILRHKGITDGVEMEEFLSDRPQKTYDPYLMKNMDKVVELISSYIKEKKSIWIYGDYDVDGITSIALLMDFFKHFTDNLFYYIPSRSEEGYGLNCDAITDIKNQGADLIITVDCGSTSVNEVELAQSLGMEIIVTDHHNLSDVVPSCLILNPKQNGDAYPFKSLCGCGIAFKLAQALQKAWDAPKRYLNDLLDLTALATVADVVPLIDENRTILKYGLRKINSTSRPGLKHLVEAVNLHEKEITTYQIGFVLAPYFNASGRIDDAKAGVELLITSDQKRIETLAQHLIRCNQDRKIIQDQGLEICKVKVEQFLREDLFLVVDSEDTHEGVIGIIAGRIREMNYKPTLIVSSSAEDGVLKGSGRSIDGIDIYEEMKKCGDLFVKFGGHKNACGFSIERSNLEELRKRLNAQAKSIMETDPEIFTKAIKIYGELKPTEITVEFIEELKKIEPYGMGNEKPYFLVRQLNVKDKGQSIRMGKNQEHLKLLGYSVIYPDPVQLQAVGFGMAEYFVERLGNPEILDLVGFPNINEWNGNKSIQFLIQDMKSNIS